MMVNRKAAAFRSLRRWMESVGFVYSEAASGSNVTFWRREFDLLSGRDDARPVAIVTAIPLRTANDSYVFQSQLLLDDVPIHEKYSIEPRSMTPMEFVEDVIPMFGMLFELEDFYVRKNANKVEVANE
jgi:hypothetical protein